MANNINWGKIYETSFWGVGVTTNTISWGKIYADLVSGATAISQYYKVRVDNDGGVIEAINCVNDASWNTDDKNWDYLVRVTNDGGIVEAFDCIVTPQIEVFDLTFDSTFN